MHVYPSTWKKQIYKIRGYEQYRIKLSKNVNGLLYTIVFMNAIFGEIFVSGITKSSF